MIGVIKFPGSCNERDTIYALKEILGFDAELVWHTEFRDKYDAVMLPGGFTYGDFLRAGIIAAYSPAMNEVRKAAAKGKPVLGICNGFQMLIEAGLLPGALLRNEKLKFLCKWVNMKIENGGTPFTKNLKGKILRVSITHNEGRYFNEKSALAELERRGYVVFRYCDAKGKITKEANPNGAMNNIAGICNPEGNVVGLMPHLERCEPLTGDEGAKAVWKSLEKYLG